MKPAQAIVKCPGCFEIISLISHLRMTQKEYVRGRDLFYIQSRFAPSYIRYERFVSVGHTLRQVHTIFYSRVSFPVTEAKQRLHRTFLHSRPTRRLSSPYHTLEISTLWAEKSTFKILKRGFQGLAKTISSRSMALVELGNQSCLIYVIFC
jgi:hypothetical protein